MSQVDEGLELSEATSGQAADDMKLVPVTESIRYRKRARSAERAAAALSEELSQAKVELGKLSEQLAAVRLEGELSKKLAAAGAVDLETAVLLAKSKVEGRAEAGVDDVVRQLKREKAFLFANPAEIAPLGKTAGAKDRVTGSRAALSTAAKRAATSGSRRDVQEYLKLRRSLV